MPAQSKQQQKFMGMVHALKKGDMKPSDASPELKKAAQSMDDKDAKDFASTSHKGLPKKVKQEILNKLKEYANSMGRDHLGGDDYTSSKKGGLRDFDGYDNVDYNKDMPMDEGFKSEYKGNDGIIWKKGKTQGGVTNFTPYYKGHNIDFGGHNFKTEKELKDFIKNYILSIQLYNKYRFEGKLSNNWMQGRVSDYHTSLRGKKKDYSGGTNFRKDTSGQPDLEDEESVNEAKDMTFVDYLKILDEKFLDAMKAVRGDNGSLAQIKPTRGDILQNFTLFRNYVSSLSKKYKDDKTKLRFITERVNQFDEEIESIINEGKLPNNWMQGRVSDYHTSLRGKKKDYSGGTNFRKDTSGHPDLEDEKTEGIHSYSAMSATRAALKRKKRKEGVNEFMMPRDVDSKMKELGISKIPISSQGEKILKGMVKEKFLDSVTNKERLIYFVESLGKEKFGYGSKGKPLSPLVDRFWNDITSDGIFFGGKMAAYQVAMNIKDMKRNGEQIDSPYEMMKEYFKNFGMDYNRSRVFDSAIRNLEEWMKRNKIQESVNEVGTNDWHFKAIKKLWDKAGSFTRKKIAGLITKNPNSNWSKIENYLKGSDYNDVTYYTDMLRLEGVVNKLKSINESQAVSGGKVHKFITGKNITLKGKKHSDVDFELISIDNKTQLVKLKVIGPKELFGHEITIDFRTLRRGPFIKTDTSKIKEYGQRLDLSYLEDDEAKLDGTPEPKDAINRNIDETMIRRASDIAQKLIPMDTWSRHASFQDGGKKNKEFVKNIVRDLAQSLNRFYKSHDINVRIQENEGDSNVDMVLGVLSILRQIDDKENRKRVAVDMIKKFKEQDIDFDYQEFVDLMKEYSMGSYEYNK